MRGDAARQEMATAHPDAVRPPRYQIDEYFPDAGATIADPDRPRRPTQEIDETNPDIQRKASLQIVFCSVPRSRVDNFLARLPVQLELIAQLHGEYAHFMLPTAEVARMHDILKKVALHHGLLAEDARVPGTNVIVVKTR